jgi:hypothetical protein
MSRPFGFFIRYKYQSLGTMVPSYGPRPTTNAAPHMIRYHSLILAFALQMLDRDFPLRKFSPRKERTAMRGH